MELTEALKTRYSVRKFADRPVEDEVLTRILEAGNEAPTGKNNQPQRIYVLKSPEAIEKIRSLSRCAFNAPVVLLIAYDENQQWVNPFEEGITSGQQDVSIVATHIMLAAWDLGIGTCWVNYFPNTKTAEAFGLPANEKPVLLMPLGWPAADSVPSIHHKKKKDLSETVTFL